MKAELLEPDVELELELELPPAADALLLPPAAVSPTAPSMDATVPLIGACSAVFASAVCAVLSVSCALSTAACAAATDFVEPPVEPPPALVVAVVGAEAAGSAFVRSSS